MTFVTSVEVTDARTVALARGGPTPVRRAAQAIGVVTLRRRLAQGIEGVVPGSLQRPAGLLALAELPALQLADERGYLPGRQWPLRPG